MLDSSVAVKQPLKDIDDAFRTLGVTSTAEYDKVAQNAKVAYDVIIGSGIASPNDQNNAMLRMLKAQADAMAANRVSIPADMQATIDALESKVGDPSKGLGKVTSKFKTFGTEVSTVITNFSQDIVKSLFEGDGSFAEKGISALKKLGEAVVSKFTEPFVAAATDLMSGVINDLLGGKGFGGILDKVKDLGKSITGVFGGGGNAAGQAAGSVANAGGAAGSVGGSVGSAAGSAGGAALAGAAGSIVGAISGVISNFQNAHQETSLNAIEHNTRYSMMFLGDRGDGGIVTASLQTVEALSYVNASIDQIKGNLSDWLKPANDTLSMISADTRGILVKLGEISSNTFFGSQAEKDNGSLLSTLKDLLSHQQNDDPDGASVREWSASTG